MIVEKVIDLMKEKKLDALLVASMYNYRYISGFTGDTAYLYISDNRRVLLTDSRYTTWARSEAKGFEVVEVDAQNTYSDIVSRYLDEDKASNIGFENTQMLYCDVIKFKNKSKNVEFVELDGQLDKIRQIKSEAELKKIAEAEKIGDNAFKHILNYIREGLTEEEVALELEMYMRKNGASKLSFETIVASGTNSAMPHATPGKRKITKGDFVTMDFGCVFEGYCSDMTRTICIGKPDEKQKEIYNTVLKAQTESVKALCAGKTGSQMDKIARDIISDAGYGKYFGHALGHSVGLYIHEEPRLSARDNSVLKENMLVTIEPGIYIPEFGGVRIEDLLVVKDGGSLNLTHSPKELIIVD